jgi:hypothetical protein
MDTGEGEGLGVLFEVSVLWGLDRGRDSRISNASSILPYISVRVFVCKNITIYVYMYMDMYIFT